MSKQLEALMAQLDPKTQATVRANLADAPPLTQRQRESLRLLFQSKDQTC